MNHEATSDSSALGARIRAERERKGLGQAEFARQVGVTPTTVWKIESGRREPSRKLSIRIADALGMSLDFLLRGAESEQRSPA